MSKQKADQKVAFITGASRGIGLATAKKFVQEGWLVAGFYKSNHGPEIKNVKWYQVDLTKPTEIDFTFRKAFSDFGKINCLVNCAGIFGYQKLASLVNIHITTVIDFHRQLATSRREGVITNA